MQLGLRSSFAAAAPDDTAHLAGLADTAGLAGAAADTAGLAHLAGLADTAGLAGAAAPGVPIIFSMSRLTCTLLLGCTPGALLLTPSSTITPAHTGRSSSLPGRHILTGILAADIPVSMAGTSLHRRVFSGDCRIIHLDLLVPAARGHTSGTPGAWMRGRSLPP
jgi:hypothetical protein